MPATQKKTGTGKAKPTSAKGKAAPKSGSQSTTKRKTKPPKKPPIYREVGAVICLLLAIFSALGYFNSQGHLHQRPGHLGKGAVRLRLLAYACHAPAHLRQALSPLRTPRAAADRALPAGAPLCGRCCPYSSVRGGLRLKNQRPSRPLGVRRSLSSGGACPECSPSC